MTDTRAIFRYRLNELKGIKGLKEFSTQCNVDRETMASYLSGSSAPTIHALVKIANGLKVSTDFLLGITNTRDPSTMNNSKFSWR